MLRVTLNELEINFGPVSRTAQKKSNVRFFLQIYAKCDAYIVALR